MTRGICNDPIKEAGRKRKISTSLKDVPKTPEHNKKVGDAQRGSKNHNFGKHLSSEHKQKISKSMKNGNAPWLNKHLSAETRNKLSDATKKYQSEHPDKNPMKRPEVRQKRSESQRGPKSHKWKGGVTGLHKQIRKSLKCRDWTLAVFERDQFTCQKCKVRGGRLNAHHIKPFILILDENNITTIEQAIVCEELWDVDNGKTLCVKCHKVEHKEQGKKKSQKGGINHGRQGNHERKEV